jgi:hypothetical protein
MTSPSGAMTMLGQCCEADTAFALTRNRWFLGCPGDQHGSPPLEHRAVPLAMVQVQEQPGAPLGERFPERVTRWRPACRPLATARSRRVTFHLYKGTKRRRTVAAGGGEKSGSR